MREPCKRSRRGSCTRPLSETNWRFEGTGRDVPERVTQLLLVMYREPNVEGEVRLCFQHGPERHVHRFPGLPDSLPTIRPLTPVSRQKSAESYTFGPSNARPCRGFYGSVDAVDTHV